jgi:hypothetical protein
MFFHLPPDFFQLTFAMAVVIVLWALANAA